MARRTSYKIPYILHRPELSLGVGKAITSYDDSGQVFTEARCYGGPMTADWLWQTKGNPTEARNYRSRGAGCSSLVDMAIRSVLYNSYSITPESLEGVPWELASVLWQQIVLSQLDSVKVWKTFACAFPHEVGENLKYKHHTIVEPNMKLSDYMNPITSPSLSWITSLKLSNITCSRTDLIQISRIINIGILSMGPNVQAPDIGIDDSIIRCWGRLAADSDAFTVLRVLRCISQEGITRRIFTYLNQFPSLVSFKAINSNIYGRDKPLALKHGWKLITGMEASLPGEEVTESFSYDSDALFRPDELPVLHLDLGFPWQYVPPQGASFQRNDPLHNSNHRTLEKVQPKLPRKKPTMRASKQQNLEEVLMGFGG